MEWNSIRHFLNDLNGYRGAYIILRNYEGLLDESIMLEHADIDILCDRSAELIEYMTLDRWENTDDQIHRKAVVNGTGVKIDLREIGDGYYDVNWEMVLLQNRDYYKKEFYVSSRMDYFYSLLYHALVHKREMHTDYQARLLQMANDLQIQPNADDLRKTLENFMRQHAYRYVLPADRGVVFNISGADRNLVAANPKRTWRRVAFFVRKGFSKIWRYLHG